MLGLTIKTNLVEMNNHIVIDTLTGLTIGASQSGLARIIGVQESSIRYFLNNTPHINAVEVQIQSSTGIRNVKLVLFHNFKEIINHLSPKLLDAAAEFGLNTFFLKQAGYDPPKNPQILTQSERIALISQEAQEYALLKDSLQVVPGQININNELMKASISILPPQSEWMTALEILEDLNKVLDRGSQWNFSRNCSNVYRTIYHDDPPKGKTGRFIFPKTLNPWFKEWVDKYA